MMDIQLQFQLLQFIRDFFQKEGFTDVMTPPMVQNPGMETHIHPFGVHSARTGKANQYYLHTSPEFHMKELLSRGLEKIFTLSYCFRDEPASPIHRSQFIMLEWYRAHVRYEKIMDDCENLFSYCWNAFHELSKSHALPLKKANLNSLRMERYTIQELFQEYLRIDILNFLEKSQIQKLLKKDFPHIPVPASDTNMSWDDYYFLLFLNEIEPKLSERDFLLLYEFPAPLCALSTLKEKDPRVCERFEIYVNGIELCNCFNELTDIQIQKKRFAEQAKEKQALYNYTLPSPQVLYESLERGLPKSSGIALGVERLLLSLLDVKNPFYI